MPADVVVLAVYSLVLVGVAQALRALGRRSTSPWASRTLAGHLRATGQDPEHPRTDEWPHSEVPRLYSGIGLVAALAATALSAGGLALHHDRLGGTVLVVVLLLSGLTLVRMAVALRG